MLRALLTALAAAGFVAPAIAAWVAYRRYQNIAPPPVPGKVTYDDVNRMLTQDLPAVLRERLDAVRMPAIWALAGIGCATVASIVSLWVPMG